MKFEKVSVSNFHGAFHGMRNPLASWQKSDSCFGISRFDEMPEFEVAYLWAEQNCDRKRWHVRNSHRIL